MTSDGEAAGRLEAIRQRVASAAHEAGRQPDMVTLVAVSKTFAAENIEPAIAAGQRIFGENRVQEAKEKWPGLQAAHPGLELHLIGPLQSNKARDAVALFDVIHTLDRLKIARALAAEMAAQGRTPKLFIQVNTGLEPQKSGIAPAETEGFLRECREGLGLRIEGLMCIPPFDAPPDEHFRLLARLAGDLGLPGLSMGMSADFETAIRLGATHVRVGSAIFGARVKQG
ncbi:MULTISPECIES: YggS family pyridoxal phosphate-dependent enzyme [Rhodomicrobium]|uniref:YggS family pyridoxal phosphate-dependent enzyme n=1 Tax=Rhodomicrobium TaxID=1068 RepID=UPI000B4AAF28|nr:MULTISPECIES: YggS family pyridoxal phosphate-dependent enzyme [Rhodomicrobium]